MSGQAFQRRPALDAWVRLLRAHAAMTRAVSADLVASHGLTINDYEVLMHLARADERRLRRVDLAEHLLLTASGITRLLDGLERSGYVRKEHCASDARVTYAVLTDDGLAKLKEASRAHVREVREQFETRYSDEELQQLAELLLRLDGSGADDESCEVD